MALPAALGGLARGGSGRASADAVLAIARACAHPSPHIGWCVPTRVRPAAAPRRARSLFVLRATETLCVCALAGQGEAVCEMDETNADVSVV